MGATRRQVLTAAGLGLLGAGLAPGLDQAAWAGAPASGGAQPSGAVAGLGPLAKAGPELALPPGFRYTSFGAAGTRMSDGLATPIAHDGQALFATGRDTIRILRNHEIDADMPGVKQRSLGPRAAYDRAAPAGVTSSSYDLAAGRLRESFLVLNGTLENCNGSPTPWGSWLSCEETVDGTGAGYEKPHGYVFEVPASARGPVEPVPLRAMGRFEHECAPVDPATGIVYLTEDNGDPGDGLYRFLPDRPGRLAAGGRLQMLAVRGEPTYDTETGQRVGERLPVGWVDIAHPDPADAETFAGSVYSQGRARGGARFLGLEGAEWANGSLTFVASEAGDAGEGQVWRYRPTGRDGGLLTLLYESTDGRVLDQPDTITVGPRGGVLMCEDGDGEDEDGGDNYLRLLTPAGRIVDLAKVIAPLDLHYWSPDDFPAPGPVGASELSGVRFTADGRHLVVNVQYPGLTCVITGPWQSLPS
ncbi:alkaline phosphatase PhoX [Pseudofrankia inefficax]|uniref:DUF839 domain-containing protein n=1 Tax=Pseudofrankia inefficax (strain DSM 45817 / CECT 9037 / DDB 130130 / EuI1c) TaxID=298654 RepID=E3J3U7_PSEI1|nr:alkaline phosphatase PhoX [Pseudofrankia inefficax]ADP80580.1 protein of unknown function DUF839 [Pseudofrankia inefficax]